MKGKKTQKGAEAKNAESRLKNRPPARENTIPRLYSMLPSDLELVEELAKKFDRKGARISNSEVVRAGLLALDEMDEEEWVDVLSRLPKCVGRWRERVSKKQRAK